MAASAIAISFDSSDESVGSLPSWVFLFGDIPTIIPSTSVIALETFAIAPVISSAALVVETTIVASTTGLCGLVPYSDLDSDSPNKMASLEYITPLPATSQFLFTDSSEDSDPSEASGSSKAPPSHDPYVTTRSSSPFDFPIAPVTAPLMTQHRPSSSSLPMDSSPVHSLGLDAQSSSGDSSERPLHSSLHSAGPSRKRCRSSSNFIPSSTPVIGSLAPTRADLLSPRKRFRDSYSPETSMEEDTKIDTIETEDGRELDIVDGDDVRDHIVVYPRDDREEFEASVGDGPEIRDDRDDLRRKLRENLSGHSLLSVFTHEMHNDTPLAKGIERTPFFHEVSQQQSLSDCNMFNNTSSPHFHDITDVGKLFAFGIADHKISCFRELENEGSQEEEQQQVVVIIAWIHRFGVVLPSTARYVKADTTVFFVMAY
nr:hypothetical protein [Tanacetum cinerariifolium]